MVILLAVVAACGKKSPAPAAQGSGSNTGSGSAGSGSAVAAAPMAPAAGSGLAFDEVKGSDDDPPDALAVIFSGKLPRMPAVSPDGKLYATIEDPEYGMPSIPVPYDLVVQQLDSTKEPEHTALFEDKEAEQVGKEIDGKTGSGWVTPEWQKKLSARGAAALQKLAGFHSLTMTDINWTESDKKPYAFGADTLIAFEGDADLTVELHDAKGNVLHRTTVDAYGTGSNDMDMCSYAPKLFAAGTDGPMLYVTVGYHYRDDCAPPKAEIFAWSLDPTKASADDAAAGMIAHQLEQPAPAGAVTNGKIKPDLLSDVVITPSHDGKSGWASGTTMDVRASDVLVKTPGGWQIAGAAWTNAVGNDDANRDAKAGKLKPVALDGEPGDAELADAFKKLTTSGVDAAAAANKGLIAIGSGPGERTEGGAGFARAWNAAWKGKVSIASLVAKTTPSGTTGWVSASVRLQKSGYVIPFLVFAVFDKTDAGWSLVHIHFAV